MSRFKNITLDIKMYQQKKRNSREWDVYIEDNENDEEKGQYENPMEKILKGLILED